MNTVVLITASNKREAKLIAKDLLKKKLCACVNIVDKIDSLFLWKGKLEEAKESLLIAKTKRSLISRLIKRVRSLHSYQVPEIIALPISSGNREYLNWIEESTI